jgi:hypothetical protein
MPVTLILLLTLLVVLLYPLVINAVEEAEDNLVTLSINLPALLVVFELLVF